MTRTASGPVRSLLAASALFAGFALSAAAAVEPPQTPSVESPSLASGDAIERPSIELAPSATSVEAAPTTAAATATELRFAELPNFHRVDENLYRGGQPRTGGLARLKEV